MCVISNIRYYLLIFSNLYGIIWTWRHIRVAKFWQHDLVKDHINQALVANALNSRLGSLRIPLVLVAISTQDIVANQVHCDSVET